MHPPVSAARWAAIRALCEGAPPAFPLVATATKLHPTTIRERASMEKWAKPNFQSSTVRAAWSARALTAPSPPAEPAGESPPAEPAGESPPGWEDMTPQERRQWLNDILARQIARIAVAAGDGALDKAGLDGVWSMMRVVERSDTLTQEPVEDNGAQSDDEELAAKLRLLDDRIMELAEEHAEWLVSQKYRGEVG